LYVKLQLGAGRIVGVDLARGIAMIGMLGAHIGFTEFFDWAQPDSWTELVHGRPSILFGLLAGVSLAIISRTARGIDADGVRRLRLQLVGRGVLIFTVGVVLELLWSPIAVILTMYGLLFVIAAPFAQWSTRRLMIVAGVLVVAGPPALAAITILSLSDGASGGAGLVLLGTYPITVWGALLFGGMCLGRLDLLRMRNGVLLLVVGAVIAAAGYTTAALLPTPNEDASTSGSSAWAGDTIQPEELTGRTCSDAGSGYVVCDPRPGESVSSGSGSDSSDYNLPSYLEQLRDSADWSAIPEAWLAWESHSGGTLELVASGGLAVAVLGLCLLIARPLRYLVAPIVAIGTMPLSVYSAHVVLFALGAGTLFASELATWATVSAALAIAALLWQLFIGRGPLERLNTRVGAVFADPAVPPLSGTHISQTTPT
jgi:hypothetical protein